ncbi:hypothetical protein PHYBLDRAFT_172667 [Phycomyces blakesleeanus NRRL 1555(-)]|uniref:Uncharacterized protein n=1 Tax=Phycomyces blakesleeanus (strain ATCC 8743b / DSM 1359 / FGSC 10004 / NBRC 33097 / NRRL 1555) TaxID=763407 RepID=A0A162TL20_PHYB8|nr:hypothetical protein PHYBLDRAFT_172667 [Phycomyces blakesleeanus NRRL 1555(-)]OAD69422.1 hypothetical protein PHYBLDRAFT_172667 [Phycomyces blakesleeanus NRRL 1555(-)]|eukprot:XP_018287462.1 hypothetical protein PHYBLDRAFT_172667 [Phycomyces blakesleeanus NRRL 1555(-)]
MSYNTNNTIYDISNVRQFLINSSLEEIKVLLLNTTISVKASEQEQCLTRINKLCSTKWNKKHKYIKTNLVFRKTRKCHRARKYESQCQTYIAQKDIKTCSCTAALQIKQYISNHNVVTFCQTRAYVYHVPGERKEIRTLSLPSETIRIIKEKLKSDSSYRSTRISVLRQINDWGVGARKPNYEEIYNTMRKMTTLLYVFASDENASISIWLNMKLVSMNYCIFDINLSVYNNVKKQFAIGFKSPAQVSIMRIKIKLNTSFTSKQLGNYKIALKNYLSQILIKSDKETFLKAINDFKQLIQDQPQFLQYFEKKWTKNEELKLDRLIFSLTNDIEFFYEQKVERIYFNNSKMGPTENELSRNSFAVSKAQDDMLPSIILNPLNEISNSMDDYNSECQIKSFITQDKCIHSCLNATVILNFGFFKGREIARVELSRQDYTNENEGKTLKTVSNLDQTDAEEMKRALAHAIQLMDKYRSKNPLYFRSLNTQR